MKSNNSKLISVGHCVKPHGIKGGFVFVLENKEGSSLEYVKSISLFPRNDSSSIRPEGEIFKILNISFGNKVIAYLEGVTDRNTTEAMIPFEININRSDLPELDSGEFYAEDFIGWEVYEHSSKQMIGKVTNYYDNGAQIIFVIEGQNKTIEIPFVENFVPVIDEEQHSLQVVIPKYVSERD